MDKNRPALHWVTILVMVLFVFLAISSSASAPPGKITMDPNLVKEESAVVIFPEFLYVKEYNGIGVESEWYPKGKWRRLTATLPGGEAHLLFDVGMSYSRGNTIYTFSPKDLELKFNFEAGKEYTVGLYLSKNEGNFLFPRQRIFLAVWDRIYSDADPGNSAEDHVIKSWELGEF